MKTITVGKDGVILLKEFKEFIDIKKVKYYEFKKRRNSKILVLKFYDKNKKLLKPNTKSADRKSNEAK